jgi:RNA polymerase sigma factor (sigma-70 family)
VTTVAQATEAGTTTDLSQAGRLVALEREAAGNYIGQLFVEHGRMVLGLCRLLLRDAVEAEDATQQAFVSAHQAVLRGSIPRDAAAWIAAIARNECRARIRARMREPLELPELPSDLPDPLASAIRAADLNAIWTALGTLPRRQRNALVLRELGGLSYHELGRALGVSHSAVESLLFRARQQVRRFVAGANAAAVPVALRDELERVIPGFDPGSAGVVGRIVALPVAWKLTSAAVGVGVVATGAGELHRQATPQAQREHAIAARVAHAPAPARPQAVISFQGQPVEHARAAPRASHGRRVQPRRHGEVEVEEREPVVAEHQEHGAEGPGPAPAETAAVEESNRGPGGGGEPALEDVSSGSGQSGADEGHGSGESGHSGPG